MQGSPPTGIDHPTWHPSWKRFAALGDRAVVLHNYGSGPMWYVIKGSPDFPGRTTSYAGDSEDAATAMFDSLCASWLRGDS